MGCRVIERRRWPRREVAWVARLLFGDGDVVAAKAMDASLHGMRLAVDDHLATRHGEKCRVEVRLANSEATFCREAEVRHVDAHSIGLAITDPLPAALVPSGGGVSTGETKTAPAKRSGLGAALGRLRSIVAAFVRG
jgi:hypothetical protein